MQAGAFAATLPSEQPSAPVDARCASGGRGIAPIRAVREQVLAFRLAGHNLTGRLLPGELPRATAACGVQDSPPGGALLALGARVRDLSPARFATAVANDKTLVAVRSLRAAPHFVPAEDLPVFTTALLPDDEDELRYFIQGAGPALDKVGLTASWVADATEVELLAALDGRSLAFRQLSDDLTGRLALRLTRTQLEAWQSPSWYGPNQCLGEAIVHFALYAVSLRGSLCFAPREGNEAAFVRTDQWLGQSPPRWDRREARAELVRRYLRCFGPSTAADFGAWAGIAPTLARHAWDSARAQLLAVDVQGKPAWLHEEDLAGFASPPPAEGIRLLPPHDPYLALRDRAVLLPVKAWQRRLWRTVGNPGAVLVEGKIAGLWRPRKVGKSLTVTVEPLTDLSAQARAHIAAEAELVAALRGCAASKTLYRE